MKVLKIVDPGGNAVFAVMLFHPDHLALAFQLDRLPRQGITEIDGKIQLSAFRKGLAGQEINAGPTDVARNRFFMSYIDRNFNLDTLRSPFLFIKIHGVLLSSGLIVPFLRYSTIYH